MVRNPADFKRVSARCFVRARSRRATSKVGTSNGEKRSVRTNRPLGARTRAHSSSPAPWSTQWSKDVELTTKSNDSSEYGSFSATPSEKLSLGSSASDVAAAIIPAAASIPSSLPPPVIELPGVARGDRSHSPHRARAGRVTGGERKICCAGRDVTVHPTAPSLFIGVGPIVKSLDISIVRHVPIMPAVQIPLRPLDH